MTDEVRPPTPASADVSELNNGPGSVPLILRSAGPAERNLKEHVRRQAIIDRTLSWLVPAMGLAVWELAVNIGGINPQFFPPPSTIAGSAWELLGTGTLLEHLVISVRRVILGFVAGVVSGVLVGFLMGLSRRLRAAFEPTLMALYTVPKLALLPLLLLIFGLGEAPKIILIGMTVFFFMWIATLSAVLAVPKIHRDAAVSFGASRRQLAFHVQIPSTMPAIFVGLRISAGVSVLVMVGAEFVHGNDGIGYFIWHSWGLFLAPRMYVGIIVVALMGLTFQLLVRAIGKWTMPWDESPKGVGGIQ